ncbi:MAG: hypothetical protein Kow00107_07660 [Planctomycetota bacterium]
MIVRVLLGISVGAALGGVIGYFGRCTTGACPLTANPWRGMLWGATLGGLMAAA